MRNSSNGDTNTEEHSSNFLTMDVIQNLYFKADYIWFK